MSIKYLLSGDIGGTKTLLSLCPAIDEPTPVLQRSYASAAYANLAEIVEAFLTEAGKHDIAAACFALAGPVSGRVVKLTNLPWLVDADEIAARCKIERVMLLNDFAAVAYGIAVLQKADLLTLQAGVVLQESARLLVGAGTGLGVAWLSGHAGNYQVHASEAGHMDFAPADEMQDLLLQHLRHSFRHVSYERIVSGPGLLAIFEFMRDTGIASPSAQIVQAMREDDAAAVITRFARQGDEEIARLALRLFLSVYGAFAGNMALAVLPRGGVYVAGGIAAKLAAELQGGEFLQAFLNKGRHANLLGELPVQLVLNPQVGLLGAQQYLRQNI